MKRTLLLISLVTIIVLVACGGRGEEGYGAGGGQSLREGSTAPYHSSIAQDETYQTVLGLNILLYPAPVDEDSFDAYGTAHWEMDPSEFTQAMLDLFDDEPGEEAIYEPIVKALQDHPFVTQVQETIYDGEPVQVGWVYGNNSDLEIMYDNDVPITLIPANDIVLFTGSKNDIDETSGAFESKNAKAYFTPQNSVITIGPEAYYSLPVRVIKESGQVTAVIVPVGVELESIPVTGANINIEAADTSSRY